MIFTTVAINKDIYMIFEFLVGIQFNYLETDDLAQLKGTNRNRDNSRSKNVIIQLNSYYSLCT